MTKLARAIEGAIGDSSVYRTATSWGVPHWIIRDTLSGKIDCPSPKYLRQIAGGLGWPVESVIDAAFSEEQPSAGTPAEVDQGALV